MVDESILSQRTIHIPSTLVGHDELSGVIPGDIYVLDRTSPKYNKADIQDYIDKVSLLTHQPAIAAYPLAGHTDQYTVFGIPLNTIHITNLSVVIHILFIIMEHGNSLSLIPVLGLI